jgi:polysaccharide biosynthesis/export protein
MRHSCRLTLVVGLWAGVALSLLGAGCHVAVHMPPGHSCGDGSCASGGSCEGGPPGGDHKGGGCGACGDHAPGPRGLPAELDKVSLPEYIIEPPDILVINTVRGTPLPLQRPEAYELEPGDVLRIEVDETLPGEPISGLYQVDPTGFVTLGRPYGSVRVAGMTLTQARAAVTAQLKRAIKAEFKLTMALEQTVNLQQVVQGEHLVRPDGTIGLGVYGDVYLAGLNRTQARAKIESHLAQFLLRPQISLDVIGYNSKVYYVIYDGGGYGQQVYRLPVTGNETVLDAIGQLNGLPPVSSKKKIWVARPAPAELGCDQVLPVDWMAITEGGSTATNYQVLPGDRIFVKADCLIAADNWLAKFLSPIERGFGVTLLGATTVNTIRNGNNFGNNGTIIGVVP